MLTTRLFAIGLLLFLFNFSTSSLAQSGPGAIRADRLGIAHISSVDVTRSGERYERALELGAAWNRWPLYWDRVEQPNGEYDWDDYDALVIEDLSHDLQLNVILLGIPQHQREGDIMRGLMEPIFADGSDVPEAGKSINPDNPWAQFAHAAVERYRPGGTLARQEGWADGIGVRVWEIWNEPDYEFFWSGTVFDYSRLLKTAYLVVETLDPDATVMVGGLLYPTQANYLAQILSVYQDEPEPETYGWYMDAVAVHNYGDSWRSGWLTLVIRQTLVEFGLEKPIWVTETGVPIWDDYPGPLWTADDPDARALLATADEQAAFMIQSAAYAWAEGAQVIIYHQLYDDCGNQPPGTDFAPSASEGICSPGEICAGDVFGIFRNPDNAICFSQHPQPDSARPVAAAYALLAEVFAQSFSRRGIIDDVREDDAIVITFTRPETGERIVVAWNTGEELAELALPAFNEAAALFVYGIEGGQTIRAEEGEYVLTLPAATMPRQRFLEDRKSVDIGGSPLILVEAVKDADELARLEYLTYESTERPPDIATPEAFVLGGRQIAELIANSPTGVSFYSTDNARVRNLPATEGTQVLGTMRIGEALPVTGRLADNSWWRIAYNDGEGWVAAFLGEVYGNIDAVPIIEVALPTAEASSGAAATPGA
jgi:hypothetical protein